MKKLIHVDDGRGQLHCDNASCGHVLPPGAVTWGEHLIGYPCPKCGSDMLTQADYLASERISAIVTWINKWFGWLGTETVTDVHASISIRHHDGKTIIKEEK